MKLAAVFVATLVVCTLVEARSLDHKDSSSLDAEKRGLADILKDDYQDQELDVFVNYQENKERSLFYILKKDIRALRDSLNDDEKVDDEDLKQLIKKNDDDIMAGVKGMKATLAARYSDNADFSEKWDAFIENVHLETKSFFNESNGRYRVALYTFMDKYYDHFEKLKDALAEKFGKDTEEYNKNYEYYGKIWQGTI